MRFHRGYFALTVVLLGVELFIALYVRDAIVRPYVGDALAVVLVHAALRTVTRLSVTAATLAALAIATAIEFGQYFHMLAALGLEHSAAARVVLGSGFDPRDFVAYAAGGIAVLVVERQRRASRARAGTRTRSPSSESSSTI